jgi:hypothetical protein
MSICTDSGKGGSMLLVPDSAAAFERVRVCIWSSRDVV